MGGYTLGKFKGTSAYDQLKNATSQKDKSDTALVTLDCASCHVPQTFAKDSPAAKTDGWYIQTVQYDTHCKACHPLTFDVAVKDNDGKLRAVPHGESFLKIESQIRDDYKKYYTPSPATGSSVSPRPLPGKFPGSPDQMGKNPDVDVLIKNATRYLTEGRAGCLECHTTQTNGGKKEIVPVNVPTVWFKHREVQP